MTFSGFLVLGTEPRVPYLLGKSKKAGGMVQALYYLNHAPSLFALACFLNWIVVL
jgi:hypothetical protein